MIQPTKDEQGRYFGVPYGSTGRLMMIYLQNEAYRNRSRRVELGRSMHAWLRAMGVDSSGKGYKAAKEQALRIERSLVSVSYDGMRGRERWQDTIIRGSFNLSMEAQPDLFPQIVELSESFYQALIRHPAVLFEPAIRHLAGKSLALDVYLWLAYRLHVLQKDTLVSWPALHNAFGPNYARERDFRAKFRDTLVEALLVYPQARVDATEHGILLHPERAPCPAPRRRLPAAQDASPSIEADGPSFRPTELKPRRQPGLFFVVSEKCPELAVQGRSHPREHRRTARQRLHRHRLQIAHKPFTGRDHPPGHARRRPRGRAVDAARAALAARTVATPRLASSQSLSCSAGSAIWAISMRSDFVTRVADGNSSRMRPGRRVSARSALTVFCFLPSTWPITLWL